MKNLAIIFQKAKPYLKNHINKYVIILVAFGVYFTFFDNFSLTSRFANGQKIDKLKAEIAYFQHETEQTELQANELLSNNNNLEKFAREKHLMKKPNEDIYTIDEE